MTYGSIYKIQFPNGKHYIGLNTTSLEQRKKGHKHAAKSDDTRCLYNALRKYDIVDTFELIEIDTADTLEELYEKEISYIIEYNSYYMDMNGYNMTRGGDGVSGYVPTEEEIKRMSERMKKKMENPEARERMKEMRKKQMENPEWRKEQSESIHLFWENNQEARERQSEITIKFNEEHPEVVKARGEKITEFWEKNPEARERQSKIKIKFNEQHPEARKAHSEKMKKLFENPEQREKYSKAQKKRFENPEERKRSSERSKKQFENPEARQQISELKKEYFKKHPEAIIKNREAQKNRSPEWIKKRNDTQGKNKLFDVFTKDGTFIKTFTYIFEANEYLQKEYNITSCINIGQVLKGSRNSSIGFVFKYKEI